MEPRLKYLREDNGYTPKQLAEYLLCNEDMYLKFETGEKALPPDITVKLADLYNVSVDYIAGH